MKKLTCVAVAPIVGVMALVASAASSAEFRPISIRVPARCGPGPAGAPAEVSVPFARGALRPEEIGRLTVVAPDGDAVPTQTRIVWTWPDGTVRWLFVTFEAEAGQGRYTLARGQPPQLKPILQEDGQAIVIDTGPTVMRLPNSGPGWFDSIAVRNAGGKLVDIVRGSEAADLVITAADGTKYRSRLARDQRVTIEDNGGVCARVCLEGKCRSSDGEALFDYIVRWQAFRGRSHFLATITWINATDNAGERVRDLRVMVPYTFRPEGIVIGCESGVYDAPFMAGNFYFVLQEDHDQYWAKRRHTDGRTLNLATGGANGQRCPGWLYVERPERGFGIYVPQFWQEYPNELTAEEGQITVGLWPERANRYLSHKPILPAHSDPRTRYRHTKYWPLLPHPYLAFFSAEDNCLDVPQGVAKTQRIVLHVSAGENDESGFETKYWGGSLLPVRAHLDPEYVASTGVFGRIMASNPKRFPKEERMMAEAFGWLNRHIDVRKCYGKFDYGDFQYMVPSTAYLTCTGKWAPMQEMPREGYWHNNERDPVRGILLHYFRTGEAAAFALARIAAQHAFDVDLRHHPNWGMYTHSYGHCYRALGTGGEPDHAWLLGLLDWACVSGDPVLRGWILRCGERLARMNPEAFAKTDLRTTSMELHMMASFYRYTGDEKYRTVARRVAEILRDAQLDTGLWMPYLGQPERKHYISMAFVSHTLMALADYIDATGDERLLPVLQKGTDAYCGAGESKWSPGEIGLVMPALDTLWRRTGDAKYADFARRVYAYLCAKQCLADDPLVRGEFWPQWGAKNRADAKGRAARPPQFLNQARPITPATVLAYGITGLRTIAEASRNQRH
ncbi:MAG: hypothetical protein GXP27_09205 [Planctomycetes bacterium]|nr:hypothetical protein [Planctomycetota bacterium]